MRAVDRLVAARRPAGAAVDVVTVVDAAVHDGGAAGLILEVTLVAEADVARFQHLVVNGAVRRVAGDTALAHDLVGESEVAALRRVTFGACGVGGFGERAGAGPAPERLTLVGVVAIDAADLAVEHLMSVGQAKFRARVDVTLKAGVRLDFGIDDGLAGAGLHVETGGAVTGFAGYVFRFPILADLGQMCMGRIVETAGDISVALHATLGAHDGRTGNLRRSEDGAIADHNTGDQQEPPQAHQADNQGEFEKSQLGKHRRWG